jgi:ABC-2 type transport system permease protein
VTQTTTAAEVRAPALTSASEPVGALSRNLRAVKMLWHREVLRLARNRVQMAMGLVTPLMFLLILGTGLESVGGTVGQGFREYRTYLFPGVLVMATQAPAIAVGISVVWDRQAGFLRQAMVAPVRRVSLLLGLSLGGATAGTLYGAMVLLIAGVVDVPYRPELLVGLLEVWLVALTFTALGMVAAVTIKRIHTFQVVVGLAMTPLMFLSGAMFPAGGLPGWLGTAVMVNPLTYAVDAVRRTLPGNLDMSGSAEGPRLWGWTPPVALELAFVVLMAFVALAVSARRFSRAE